MSTADKIFAPILYIIRHQKKMVLVALVSAVVFTILFFPYDDLADMVTSLISKNSQNQVFVQFDSLGISFFPPSIKMTGVEVESQFLPASLSAGVLKLSPSIAGFLAFNPGFTARIEEVMNGDLAVSYRGGKKINDTTRLQKIDIDLDQIDLTGLSKFAGLPMDLEGKITTDVFAEFDPNFIEQPEAEVVINVVSFRLPASTIQVPMGGGLLPVPLPNTELKSLNVKAKLVKGNLEIEEGVIGQAGDAINGIFKGRIGLRMGRMGNMVQPQWGAYDFKIKLNIERETEKNFSSYLGFISSYKTLTGTGATYALRISAPSINSNFNLTPPGAF